MPSLVNQLNGIIKTNLGYRQRYLPLSFACFKIILVKEKHQTCQGQNDTLLFMILFDYKIYTNRKEIKDFPEPQTTIQIPTEEFASAATSLSLALFCRQLNNNSFILLPIFAELLLFCFVYAKLITSLLWMSLGHLYGTHIIITKGQP